jgi:hypothetical protein
MKEKRSSLPTSSGSSGRSSYFRFVTLNVITTLCQAIHMLAFLVSELLRFLLQASQPPGKSALLLFYV